MLKRICLMGCVLGAMLTGMAGMAAAQVVTADGVGASEILALRDAKRAAIEEVMGSAIKSETVVQNGAVTSDNIWARSQGFAKNVKILQRSQAGGLWRVRASIDVGERPGLASGHATLGVPAFNLNGLLSPEQGWSRDELQVVDDFAVQHLQDTGRFVLLDRTRLQEIEAERNRALASGGDLALQVGSGSIQGAQYLVFGTVLGVTTRRSETTVVGAGTKRAGVHASVSLRIVDVETGAIVTSAIGRNRQVNHLVKAPLGLVRIGTDEVDKEQVLCAIEGAVDDAVNGPRGLMARIDGRTATTKK